VGDAQGRGAAERISDDLRKRPLRWLVTGGAGFIGSHVVEKLLELGQHVVVLDNFSTGSAANLGHLANGDTARSNRIEIVEGDIRDLETCRQCCRGADIVLHQAAAGSVPRSIADPATINDVNVGGFLNMLVATRDEKVSRLVYASSSSVYGDDPRLPRVEGNEGNPLSPYAASKRTNELYAAAFQSSYGSSTIGLRYFNVFGSRQNPDSEYAAVIPRWMKAMFSGAPCVVYGDGQTSRDFCYVANIVQANLLAALAPAEAVGAVYNIAYGEGVTLNRLFDELRSRIQALRPGLTIPDKVHQGERPGDVRYSWADVARAKASLGYAPTHDLSRGLDEAMAWYAVAFSASAPG
jgi:UDP-N-acetylglucosamine 4-epimerase